MLHAVNKHGSVPCQMEKDAKGVFKPITYREAMDNSLALMHALLELGVKKGDFIGLMSDNRAAWLWADLATLSIGAADVPRGRDSTAEEICFILKTVEAKVSFVENRDLLTKVLSKKEELPLLETIILLDDKEIPGLEESAKEYGVKILYATKLIESHFEEAQATQDKLLGIINEVEAEDLATIIFTSGTTGEPKGVMITHKNFLSILDCIAEQEIPFHPGDRWLNVLPVWHSFERIVQYISIHEYNTLCYSKPIGKIMLADIQRLNPTFMSSVPRIWETIKSGVYATIKKEGKFKAAIFDFALKVGNVYTHFTDIASDQLPYYGKKPRIKQALAWFPKLLLQPLNALFSALVFSQIKQKLGKNFVLGVSGGGSFSPSVENFFRTAGIRVLNGYGMTETSPVISLQWNHKPTKGTMRVLGCGKVEIRDENGKVLPPGQKGVLYFQGPQVMKGYYKRPETTAKIIGNDGFINTGDLAVMTTDGLITIVGRAKDTIVLSGGENIEPIPIEATLNESPYIETSVVVGQDEKYLSALIVPNTKEIERYLKDNKVFYVARDGILDLEETKVLIDNEIRRLVSKETGFKSFELINRFALLQKSFEVNVELSAKQELKRFKIAELYAKEIKSCYN